ncbi:Sec-independent protein translocase subunit TatA/TatB [Dictyobacter arantiisoli]|uniref:Sec-independent protein translocase protein TatA n=1 Tax=Dictyobacter arantiisoli TaxID=2014874 RepID=A0A5A5T6Q9_9CHLR|nr:twin-arginine translocase TatA/TatE family subunit [Dictyobacter arantiisoli]GCF07077.1 hypothetical protein KDI_06410 [Dictyobacter arantiisoli]
MRILEIIVIAGIILALFGPKTLQSLSHRAGKTAGEAKNMKDKFMAHDDVAKMRDTLNKVPTSPREAAQMLLSSNEKSASPAASATPPREH